MKKMLFSIKGILTAISAMLVLIVGLIASYEKAPPADLSFAAIPGNEVQGNLFVVGGSKNHYYGEGMSATTSNVCSFRAPNATSTVVSAAAQTTMTAANNVGSTIHKLKISLGATTWATSTALLAGESVAIGKGLAVVATTTPTTAAGAVVTDQYLINRLVPPNFYVNFGIEGTSSPASGGFKGNCRLHLLEL